MDDTEDLQRRLRNLKLNSDTFKILLYVLQVQNKDKYVVLETMNKRVLTDTERISNGRPAIVIKQLEDSKIGFRVVPRNSSESAEEVIFKATVVNSKPKNSFKPFSIDDVVARIRTMPRAGEFTVTIIRNTWESNPPQKIKHLFSN